MARKPGYLEWCSTIIFLRPLYFLQKDKSIKIGWHLHSVYISAMKKILVAILLFGGMKTASAQVMQAKAQYITISIPQAKCWECRDRLDKYLLREKGPTDDAGIIKWNINMTSGTIRIQYFPDRINADYLRTAINNAGFDADSTTATEDSYKKLPPICKRAAEGGGQQKGQPPCKLPPNERSMVTAPKDHKTIR